MAVRKRGKFDLVRCRAAPVEEEGYSCQIHDGLLRDRGISLLVIEHNMRLVADIADRVVVMDAGELLASGTPAEVAADDAVRAAYLGS